MATSETIIEEFDDLGFTLDDPQVVDRLVRLEIWPFCTKVRWEVLISIPCFIIKCYSNYYRLHCMIYTDFPKKR